MEVLQIKEHSIAGWLPYAQQIGFVPDPMILRTGEIFLNGQSGIKALERSDFDVGQALRENIGGLLDFFDMLVTRDTIPLINYGDTFDRMKIVAPLDQMLPNRMRPVEIDYGVYNLVKKGALINLAKLDLGHLENFGRLAREMDAFRYEWEPALTVPDADPAVQEANAKFKGVANEVRTAAQFLLGGFIFSGFAQAASGVTHYIQPKRARFLLALTAASERTPDFSREHEDAIFATAAARLKEAGAEVHNAEPVPPVLPYLFEQGEPAKVGELLKRAIEFRESHEGRRYRSVVKDIRKDGIKARRAEEAVRREREEALKFLTPYSKLDPERSRGLEFQLSAKTVGIPGVEAEAKLIYKAAIPIAVRVWWNDWVPFGGVSKTLRRMWMAAESYQTLEKRVGEVWARS
jgi:hypothetical protein